MDFVMDEEFSSAIFDRIILARMYFAESDAKVFGKLSKYLEEDALTYLNAEIGKTGIKARDVAKTLLKCTRRNDDTIPSLDDARFVLRELRLGTEESVVVSLFKRGNKTGTVWDNITATQENYPNTIIPKSFEIEVNGQRMWVHGNATKHMYENVYKEISTGNGTAYTNPNLYTQELLNDFYGSLEQAITLGITYGKKITKGNWEFIFAEPRHEGQLPVIKHAQFNGWH